MTHERLLALPSSPTPRDLLAGSIAALALGLSVLAAAPAHARSTNTSNAVVARMVQEIETTFQAAA